jgi:dihydroorotate dehydrogenase (fumarate)
LALATVYNIKQNVKDFTVIGVGGVKSADDVIEFLLAGADGVQMLSGALLKGKDLYRKIVKNLPKALEKYGFNSVEEVIQYNLNNPVTYEKTVPTLIEEECTKCNLCVRVCPYFAITMKDKITFDHDKCFGCGLCISKCPVNALK